MRDKLRVSQLVVTLLSVMVCAFFGASDVVFAEEAESPAGFNYKINYPDNQTDKSLGYYKLMVEPGQEQKLSMTFNNPSKEKISVSIAINSAKTNQNGVIEYGISKIKKDDSLKFDLKDILKGPEKVELAPDETKTVEFTVKMPDEAYDGVISGGIEIQKDNQEGTKTEEGGTKIINKYAYVVGVVLQENDKDVPPELKLNKVEPGQSNYRNAIFINFSNIMPSYVNDMTTEVKIMKKGSETVLYEKKQTAMRMAPNSFINYPVSMNGEPMKPGNYEADILVTSGERNQTWHWKQAFEITSEEADKFNNRDVGLVQEKGFNWKLVAMIVGLLLIIIFIIVFLLYRKKKKEEAKKKKSKRRNKK
ncbi:DUF916 and DUF3324 domain-containing protein [Vagococcus bubulae]|uniref:DUF916 and DUF3324 domain-containing protein n=1 Tax=Vagococcus bubulae TaxID=1977868 RepID=UPI0022E799EE|nr:DUF916 and DUF3324 domain-containing protein [Vagococcus bubulae]